MVLAQKESPAIVLAGNTMLEEVNYTKYLGFLSTKTLLGAVTWRTSALKWSLTFLLLGLSLNSVPRISSKWYIIPNYIWYMVYG